MASKDVRAINRSYRSRYAHQRVPTQPPGEPQGKHLGGFKGMKVEGTCLCGRCHPNARKDVVVRV